jgi:hypothetical protein
MNSAGLLEWHHFWRLEKHVVYCRQCGAAQAEQDGEEEFEHGEKCPTRYRDRRPWCVLHKLVKEV